ncbi:hypothetical protein FACS1894211_06900 [Clostridia bacterium]|nr:hypothetical protein FACS1894211_06900 [Clostridia bacterium]
MSDNTNEKLNTKLNSGNQTDFGKLKTEYREQRGVTIPQYEIDALARAFLPAILNFYRSEEGQREFSEWKANRNKKLNKQLNNNVLN